ncbi:MAG: alpha/beta fold hydrolase [Anaerolineaceae bacterium]|nr:alpha/beta fold hydrolase [Anaerolineaceae bacterium]
MFPQFSFPVGYQKFHPNPAFNFPLNRWYSFGYARFEDMQEAGEKIKSIEDWKDVMQSLAEKAFEENRLLNGTFYIRASEFFAQQDDPEKPSIYENFLDLFYNQLFKDLNLERAKVPYLDLDTFLPAYKLHTQGKTNHDPIVIHGGFDSLIEELFSVAAYFSNLGYEVILFDGPGQGGSLRHHGLHMDYAWEKPAKAILDHFDLENVTWIGLSMGGWLCFRAAALEPRIKRVVASSVAYDYMKMSPRPVEALTRWLYKKPKLTNKISENKMKKDPLTRWVIENLMYISNTKSPIEAGLFLQDFNAENLKSASVKQDVLILTGEKDHMSPLKMHQMQIDALTNAKSITDFIFTETQHGHQHCQVGNLKLALDTISNWIAEFEI